MFRIVDLTLTLRTGMRGVQFESAKTIERDGWNARLLHLYSHAGTHMDAQTHFDAGPETIDQVPLERCAGIAWVVSLDGVAPREVIRPDQLGNAGRALQPGHSLLLRTGWSRHAAQPDLYRDQLPRVGEDLARWCVERRVRILGVEPPSVADVNQREELTRVHKILLGGGVGIVEGLANLSELQQASVFFAAIPLKVENGDGCPCRAFAIEGDLHSAIP